MNDYTQLRQTKSEQSSFCMYGNTCLFNRLLWPELLVWICGTGMWWRGCCDVINGRSMPSAAKETEVCAQYHGTHCLFWLSYWCEVSTFPVVHGTIISILTSKMTCRPTGGIQKASTTCHFFPHFILLQNLIHLFPQNLTHNALWQHSKRSYFLFLASICCYVPVKQLWRQSSLGYVTLNLGYFL